MHDQELIADCHGSPRFADLSVTYLFVGPRPTDGVADDVKMVVARDWTPNYEHLPQFYDFTGWWVLADSDLVESEYLICLQDDMKVVSPNLDVRCVRMLQERGPIGFTAGHRSAGNWMLMIDGFAATFKAGMALRGIDVDTFPDFEEWPTTQGTAWRTDDFKEFMAWFEPLFDLWTGNVWAGHLAERSMWAWMMSRGHPSKILPNVIWHQALDRHGTGALMSGSYNVYHERAATFGHA